MNVQYCTVCQDAVECYNDHAAGTLVCQQCGFVLNENNIVQEQTFTETGGQSRADGQFVSTGYGGSGEGSILSRERTISRARDQIDDIASRLNLDDSLVQSALRMYMSALSAKFTRGRRLISVCAACLYIACRLDHTPHMLIDFSEVTNEDMYVIGHYFVQLAHLLQQHLPIVDPSLYIHRFVSKLGFEDQDRVVAMTALKLIARMKRDWLEVGRRPAGICAAALLLAGRIHGIRKTHSEIVRAVRICEITLRKRLAEFENTPTAALTPDEFSDIDTNNDDSYEGLDPPSFLRNRALESSRRTSSLSLSSSSNQELTITDIYANSREQPIEIEDSEDEEEEEEEEENDEEIKNKDEEIIERNQEKNHQNNDNNNNKSINSQQTRKTSSSQSKDVIDLSEISNENIEKEIEEQLDSKEIQLLESDMEKADEMEEKYQEMKDKISGYKAPDHEDLVKTAEQFNDEELNNDENDEGEKSDWAHIYGSMQNDFDETDEDNKIENNNNDNGEMNKNSKEDKEEEEEEEKINDENDIGESFSDLDEEELDQYINTPEEVVTKQQLWRSLNKDWIEEQDRKRQEAIERGEDPDAPPKPTRKRKRTQEPPASSAAEATANMLSKRTASSRINFDALEGLYDSASMPEISKDMAKREEVDYTLSHPNKRQRIDGAFDDNTKETEPEQPVSFAQLRQNMMQSQNDDEQEEDEDEEINYQSVYNEDFF